MYIDYEHGFQNLSWHTDMYISRILSACYNVIILRFSVRLIIGYPNNYNDVIIFTTLHTLF